MLHVVVVGGGPAGLIAAEALAKAGLRTTLVERQPERVGPCTGLLTQHVMETFDIPERLLAQRIQELAVFSPSQRAAFLTLAGLDRFAGVMPRDLLQSLLRRRAEEAGVIMVAGRFVRFRHGEGDYPLLEVLRPDGERDQIQADVVIGADGVHSRVARTVGAAPLPLGLVYQERLALPPSGYRIPEGMQLYFGRKVSSDHYGWLIPQFDHLLVGVSTHVRFGRRIWDMLAELKRRLGNQLDGTRTVGRESFCFPLEARKQLVYDRVLLVGDAAGLTPPATRDGLYYACQSGLAAAETIIRHQHLPVPERLAEYSTAWWAQHGAAYEDLRRLETTFFATDRRREALLELAWDRDFQRVAVEAFMHKRRFTLPLKIRWRLKTKVVSHLVKYSLINPRRLEGDPVGKAMPAGENYLDLALKTGSDALAPLPPHLDPAQAFGADISAPAETDADEPVIGVGATVAVSPDNSH